MFHRVAPRSTATTAVSRDLTVAPETFAGELLWLRAHGYHPIRQTDLFLALFDGARLPRRPVVITFDDGYVDATATILPLLRRYRWPATFYVITGRAGEAAFLTWPEIVALDRAGMDIGSHTVDHLQLPSLTAGSREHEVVDSKRMLEHHLGHPVYWFAYPGGRFDAASEEALRQAGYLMAFTTQPGSEISVQTPLAEPRVRVPGAASVAEFGRIVAAAGGGQ